MRNCFVPGCDSFCKANDCVQRKMFSAPKSMITQWKDVLPKTKREFKDNDRVCERHFNPEDITEYWENNINGIIHRTKRDKPKLNSTAIPSRNLEVDNLTISSAKKSQQKANKMKVIPKRPIHEIIEYDDYNDENPSAIREVYISSKKIKNDIIEDKKANNSVEQSTNESIQMNCSPIRETNEPIDEEKLEAFELLYDEIHDVTLPNTLWGHHRCSERKFMVFSSFNDTKMNFNKFLYINERLVCKVFVNGKSKTLDLDKDKCNPQHISDWLEKIDEEE